MSKPRRLNIRHLYADISQEAYDTMTTIMHKEGLTRYRTIEKAIAFYRDMCHPPFLSDEE